MRGSDICGLLVFIDEIWLSIDVLDLLLALVHLKNIELISCDLHKLLINRTTLIFMLLVQVLEASNKSGKSLSKRNVFCAVGAQLVF